MNSPTQKVGKDYSQDYYRPKNWRNRKIGRINIHVPEGWKNPGNRKKKVDNENKKHVHDRTRSKSKSKHLNSPNQKVGKDYSQDYYRPKNWRQRKMGLINIHVPKKSGEDAYLPSDWEKRKLGKWK